MVELHAATRRPVSIFVIEAHPAFRLVLIQFLQSCRHDVTLVGHAATAEEALQVIPPLSPEVLLFGVARPEPATLAPIAWLRSMLQGVRIVLLALYDVEPYREVAHRAGADVIVSKSHIVKELMPVIRRLTAEGSASGGSAGADA